VAAFLLDAKAADSQSDVDDPSVRDTGMARPLTRQVAVLTQPPSQKTFWLFCAFTSGSVTISMQVVWSRMLAMIIGSSTYAFSMVLALFLAGLALGGYLVSAKQDANRAG